MKARLLAVAVLILTLSFSLQVQAQAMDPEAVVKALYDAYNAGDTDALKALYADDAVVNLVDWEEVLVGDQIHEMIEGLVASHFAVELDSIEVDGSTVTVTMRAWADDSRELGIAPLVSTDIFELKDGMIASQTSTLDDDSRDKLMAAMAGMPETGGTHHPSPVIPLVLGCLLVASAGGVALLRSRLDRQT